MSVKTVNVTTFEINRDSDVCMTADDANDLLVQSLINPNTDRQSDV